jgi:signal transduction histidine kinase
LAELNLPPLLIEGFQKLVSGDFSYRIPRSMERDEEDTIAFYYNAVAEELGRIIRTTQAHEQRLTQSVEAISAALVEVAAGNLEVAVERDYRGDQLDVLAFLVNTTISELDLFVAENQRRNAEIQARLESAVEERTRALSQALDDLQAAQQDLIQSEKMAALGQLIAGIAHEINSPLGAIGASIGNISNALDDSIQQLPQLFQRLSPQQQDGFFALLDRALRSQDTLSSIEERKFKRALSRELEAQGVDEADTVADTLVDMGIYEDVDAFIPLFQSENADLILQTAYNLSSQQKNSRNIVTAVERASRTVFALKRYIHRDPSGKMIEANVTDGLEVVLTLYHNQMKHGVEVIKKFQPVPAIRCAPDELNQVWTNLIHNALQAMNFEGRLEIAVFQEDGQVVTQITDSGHGIPDTIKERVFEPFFTTKPAGEGSGLGLDIVRKIVERHKGKVEVESRPGRTTFSVRLPIDPSGGQYG